MQHIIHARRLTKIYDGDCQVAALRGVDLRVDRSSFLAIMGPSGSGKSSLLNILGALERPSSGEMLIEGTDIGLLSDDARAEMRLRRVGFVFQQFNLLPIFSAIENAALPLRLAGATALVADKRAAAALQLVGLADWRHHLPAQLSGGQQQRVAIARALVHEPAVVLADEPTGSLDSASGQRVISIFRELVDKHGQTVVLVTHDPLVAAEADRVVCLRDGVVVDDYQPRRAAAATAMAGGSRR